MRFPHDSNGYALLVRSSIAVAPFGFGNGFRYDGLGRVVIAG
jgi:hypothetical protein